MARNLAVLALILGLATSAAAAPGSLTVTYTTQSHGGPYAPRNIVAAWIETSGGTFVKTIDRWAQTRRQHLVAWTAKSGAADADAISGATRSAHGQLTATWDLKDRQGNEIPDGTYTIRLELADSNATTATQNDQGTFTFTKGGSPSTQSALTSGGFSNVSIAYVPAASATCNNGTIDPGETCDPPGSCPTTCAASEDPCMINTLTGSAAGCTAACVLQPSTAPECAGVTGEDSNVVLGGCDADGRAGAGLAGVLLALALVLRPRRRA